jgi:hypothetical protein
MVITGVFYQNTPGSTVKLVLPVDEKQEQEMDQVRSGSRTATTDHSKIEWVGEGLELAEIPAEENNGQDRWKEFFSLQEAYKQEWDRELAIDYEREQTLFDIAQGYTGQMYGLETEDELDQKLQDNRFEEGENLESYQERMKQFASLTKEMLIMRLASADTNYENSRRIIRKPY